MTEKLTLEEIEALASAVAKGPWGLDAEHQTKDGFLVRELHVGKRYGKVWLQSAEHCGQDGLTAQELIAASDFMLSAPRLLEIAQELDAKVKRLEKQIADSTESTKNE